MPKKGSLIEPIILQHAILLFGDGGYDGVSTRDLARAAKTTESSIYRLYKSKERLYEVAIKDVGKRAQGSMGQVLLSIARGGPGGPRKQIADTVRGWHTSLLRADARVLQQVLKQVHPYDRKYRDLAYGPISEIVAIVSGQLQSLLKAKDGPGLSTEMLIWAIFELKIMQVSGQPSKDESAKVNSLIENWLDLVLPKK
ncbi:MAG TPA: TetR/AcrR family transcriptional regulator [Candidatus Saccharimonadales bacterium]|jgi:AcrR family transcriptional regulator|nr:TetR/AcrR family transcriptional regulator [Candidatus Saccharimonadales bacterium]